MALTEEARRELIFEFAKERKRDIEIRERAHKSVNESLKRLFKRILHLLGFHKKE